MSVVVNINHGTLHLIKNENFHYTDCQSKAEKFASIEEATTIINKRAGGGWGAAGWCSKENFPRLEFIIVPD